MLSKAEISRHLHILLAHQHPDGSFPACPDFPPYRYCWFRDGSFTAHALDRYGHHQAARRFHQWCTDTILRHESRLAHTRAILLNGDPLDPAVCFPCRFTLEGQPLQDGWGNHQLDGLGTWLWAVGEHLQQDSAPPPADWQQARLLAADFLGALWRFPCYDCWEEHPEDVHVSTLAAVYGGLRSYGRSAPHPASASAADAIREHVLEHGTRHGHLVKRIGQDEIDASLLGAAVPYGLVAPGSALMTRTLQAIEDKLVPAAGGVHRYLADTYYGGGTWVLLAAWKGWVHAHRGEWDRARRILAWVQQSADDSGYLPEQTSQHLLAPDCLAHWEDQWGPSATPLLWSHSMALILQDCLPQAEKNGGSHA